MSRPADYTAPLSLAPAVDFYKALRQQTAGLIARYRSLTPRSASLAERAQTVMPGGGTRVAIARRPYAPFVVKGEGAVLLDADDRRIVDFWFNATALALGHCDARVVAAVAAQLQRGASFFAPTDADVLLAEEIRARLPSCEQVVFTNSGTEAVMTALRIARAATGRDLLAKFEGSYHGSYDDVMWSVAPRNGSGGDAERPRPVAASAGLSPTPARTLVLPYNDAAATEALLTEHGTAVAAVIVEPVANRMGLVVPRSEFLRALRETCTRLGIVLIFDEVLAFRVGYGGAQGWLGITPDLTTLGKIIGGGFPVGAVGGRRDLMAVASSEPRGPVPHYGTFSANPVTMVAGRATLEALTPDALGAMNAAGERLRRELRRICSGLPLQVTGTASLFKITATPHPIADYRDASGADLAWQEAASLALLVEGFWLTPQLHGCLATATRDEHIDAFLDAFARVVGRG
jgi:glutamate-1-semialdehyde 2,1-aminomutase